MVDVMIDEHREQERDCAVFALRLITLMSTPVSSDDTLALFAFKKTTSVSFVPVLVDNEVIAMQFQHVIELFLFIVAIFEKGILNAVQESV